MCVSVYDVISVPATQEPSTEMVSRESIWAGGRERAGGREFTFWYF